MEREFGSAPRGPRALWWVGIGVAVAVCAAAVMTVGLTDRSDETEVAPVTDACRLISPSDARAVLGAEAVRRRDAGACTFIQKGRLRSVTVSVVPQTVDPDSFGEDLERFADSVGSRRGSVRGVGDEAYTIMKPSIAQIQVRVGERAFAIVLLNVDRDEGRARDLLARLGREAAGRFV